MSSCSEVARLSSIYVGFSASRLSARQFPSTTRFGLGTTGRITDRSERDRRTLFMLGTNRNLVTFPNKQLRIWYRLHAGLACVLGGATNVREAEMVDFLFITVDLLPSPCIE